MPHFIETDELVPSEYIDVPHAELFAVINDEWESVRMGSLDTDM